MNDFWAQRLERASRFGHNFANIPVQAPGQQASAPVQPRLAMQRYRADVPLQSLQPAIAPTLVRDRAIQAKSDTTGDRPNSFLEQQPNKTGLPDALKVGIESLSGYSLDNVRVHYNSPKPAQLQALAYTQGTEIHVASGQEQHLPYEAWHVVQQAQGRVQPTIQMKDGVSVNDGTGLEHEADVMGEKALQMNDNRHDAKHGYAAATPLQMQYAPDSPVQRVVLSRVYASVEGKGKYITKYYSSHDPKTVFDTYEEAHEHDIEVQAKQVKLDRGRRYPTNFSYHREKSHNAIPNTKQGSHSLSHSSLYYRLGIRFDSKDFDLRQLRDEQVLSKEEFERLFEREAPSNIKPQKTLRATTDYNLLYDQLDALLELIDSDQLDALLKQTDYYKDLAYELIMRLLQMNPYSAYGKGKQGINRMKGKHERKEDGFSAASDENAKFNDNEEYGKFQQMRRKLYPPEHGNEEESKDSKSDEDEMPRKKRNQKMLASMPSADYQPTARQNEVLQLRNLRLNPIEADGFCIFASVGAMLNLTGIDIQRQVLNAIDKNTDHIRLWINDTGYSYREVRRTMANIRICWNSDIADIMLHLIATVLGVGFTVINPDGTTTVIGDGTYVLVRVTDPVAHYHATQN